MFDIDPDDLEDNNFTPEVDSQDAYTPSTTSSLSRDSSVDRMDSNDAMLVTSHTSKRILATKRPLIQSKLPFKRIPVSEWRAQESRRYHQHQEEYAQEAERLRLAEVRKKMKQRERERLRKRAQRARQKKARDEVLQRLKNQNITRTVCL